MQIVSGPIVGRRPLTAVMPGVLRSFLKSAAAVAVFVSPTLVPDVASATVVVALWTFESPNIPSDSTGQSSGPWSPATGSGLASGFHTSSLTTWSTPPGNGSADSFMSSHWAIGDYYQFQVATTGLRRLQMFWDQTRSFSGPSNFDLQYRVGSSGAFTSAFSYVVPERTWSATSPRNPPDTSFSFKLPVTLSNQPEVFFRLTATSSPLGTNGQSRIDNVQITAVPEPGSVGLAACGIAAVGFGAWRCRRQAGRRGGSS